MATDDTANSTSIFLSNIAAIKIQFQDIQGGGHQEMDLQGLMPPPSKTASKDRKMVNTT